MSDHQRLPCPLPSDSFPLQPECLTSEQKEWLVDEIRYHGRLASELGEQWGLKPHTLRRWKRKLAADGQLHHGMGRPRLLDVSQIDELKARTHDSTAQLHYALNEQFAKRSADSSQPIKKPSMPTIRKYERIISGQPRKKRPSSDKPTDPANIPPRLPCPLSRSHVPLKPEDLSAAQKEWLVNEMRYFGRKFKDLGEEWGLNPHTMSQWKRKINLKGQLNGPIGRPALLDEKQIEELKQCDPADLGRAIEEQLKRTLYERGLSAEPCKRTKRNYERALKQQISC